MKGKSMGKRKLLCILVVSCFMMLLMNGCNGATDGATETGKTAEGKLTVKIGSWNDIGSGTAEENEFTTLNKGDVIYDTSFGVITIKSVDDHKVVLNVDGAMVEPNSDGTINLRKDPITKITLNAGESIRLASQTMDAGVHMEISFE